MAGNGATRDGRTVEGGADEQVVDMGGIPANGAEGCHEGATEQTGTAACGGTWLLQTEAAMRSGFSVSAIRKWRRMGVVADRRVAGPGGIERVEVKLEDVVARAALQPERQRLDPVPGDTPPHAGRVVLAIDDLESLFERMLDAERRADRAEAEAESLRGQAGFMYGQLAELRRQLEGSSGQFGNADRPIRSEIPMMPPRGEHIENVNPAPSSAETLAVPPLAMVPAVEVPSVNGEPKIVTTHQRGGRDALRIAAPAGRQSPAAQNARAVPMELEALVRQLRRTYGRLDDFRRETTLTQATERRRQQTLVEYDRQLLNVCAVLGIPTGLADGEAMTVEARGVLTRALARAGFDVRAELRQAPAQKAWRMRLNHRF